MALNGVRVLATGIAQGLAALVGLHGALAERLAVAGALAVVQLGHVDVVIAVAALD